MSTPWVGNKASACLACVARRTTTVTTTTTTTTTTTISRSQTAGGCAAIGSAFNQQQVRGQGTKVKKAPTTRTGKVIIRLLQDVPKYGAAGRILRAGATHMRTGFFPRRQAEYLTRERMLAESLTDNDIQSRDRRFGTNVVVVEEEISTGDAVEDVALKSGLLDSQEEAVQGLPEPEQPKHGVQVEQLAPERALELMTTLLPETLSFERRKRFETAAAAAAAAGVVPATAPKPDRNTPEAAVEAAIAAAAAENKKLSPMQIWRIKTLAEAELKRKETEEANKTPEQLALEQHEAEVARREAERAAAAAAAAARKIYGSVSLRDVAETVKKQMLLDPEAARITVLPENIRFVSEEEAEAGVEKVEMLGSYEVEIVAMVGKEKVEPVRKWVEVVPLA